MQRPDRRTDKGFKKWGQDLVYVAWHDRRRGEDGKKLLELKGQ
jgi:hypothetical protein